MGYVSGIKSTKVSNLMIITYRMMQERVPVLKVTACGPDGDGHQTRECQASKLCE